MAGGGVSYITNKGSDSAKKGTDSGNANGDNGKGCCNTVNESDYHINGA